MSKKYIRWSFWSGAMIWMIAIFIFSAQNSEQSNNLSGGFIREFLSVFAGFNNLPFELQDQYISGLQSTVRTFAHAATYGFLSILVSCAMLTYQIKLNYHFLISIGICFVYAVFDEIHQYFVPGRAMQFSDVLVDTLGALVGWMIVMALVKIVNSFPKAKKA